ncbi:uncharacterized protein LOC111314616 [Durio zibethinus]|uniref:Uncharacterized protein LOC111314616 n=1 Tax=Durio zibethinus TaxID=66656 RepID=A0A6P6B405_DURZI|nr:uncharacterized protein LOC111314616 [Durio zibethinus]
MANAQLKAQYMAQVFAMESSEGTDHFYDKSFFSCLPGSEISETFKNRSTNSSITVKLVPDCSNKRFLGFILCFVVDFEHHLEFFDISVNCKCQLKTKCGDHHDFAYRWNSINPLHRDISFDSNHVILFI